MTDDVLKADREHHDRVATNYNEWYVDPIQWRLLNGELIDDIHNGFPVDRGLLVEFGAGTAPTPASVTIC